MESCSSEIRLSLLLSLLVGLGELAEEEETDWSWRSPDGGLKLSSERSDSTLGPAKTKGRMSLFFFPG